MSTQFPSEQYTRFASPDRNSPPPEQWAKEMLDNQKLLNVGRRKIALFDNFPPEYVDYYKALQEEIAKRIPAEQDRPFICLNIKGHNRAQDQSPADVGMAGGTGPLSDATALENLVRHMSHVGHSSLADHRDEVATRMENFSGVMYSMPPFRDLSHAYDDFNAYRSLYKSVRENLPCSSLHILTNTGHSNKWVFDSKLFFGNKKFGHVDDMTVKVAHRIKQESAPGEGVLILGTVAADKAQLYLRLLDKRGLSPAVPTELYKEQDAKLYLQLIIDQAKSGKVNENMPNEEVTCGQAFIDFAVHYAKKTGCKSLLFSCTELPMLLHTKIPNEDRTYLDKLKDELAKTGVAYKYYDTEEIFVEEIAKKSKLLQANPTLRSSISLGISASPTYNLNAEFNELKHKIENHCTSFIGKTDEKSIHKKNVLMAALQYFEDGDKRKFSEVIKANPRYADASMLWGSTTLALVADGIQLANRLAVAKSMKYENMIDPINKSAFAERYNQSQDKFTLKAGASSVFTDRSYGEEEIQAAETNWKAHISIHPEDLGKAWDLIYPMLQDQAKQFSVVDANSLKDALHEQRRLLEHAENEQRDFAARYMSNEVSDEELRSLAEKLSSEPSEYEHLLGDKQKLFEYIDGKYAEHVGKAKLVVEEGKRRTEGMQITLYMQPGTEKSHQKLLNDIEQVLASNNIRPGTLHQTDRPIGTYSSVRHPGADYHDALAAGNYNPDNAPDNFEELMTSQIQSYETRMRQQIDQLKSFKVNDTMSENEKHNVQVKNKLGRKLEDRFDAFSNNTMQGKIKEFNTFKTDCVHDIKAADKEIKNDKEWKPLLKNLALLFSGLGTLMAIASLGYRLATGRYGLFDNKQKILDVPAKIDAPKVESISDGDQSVVHFKSLKQQMHAGREESRQLKHDVEGEVHQVQVTSDLTTPSN